MKALGGVVDFLRSSHLVRRKKLASPQSIKTKAAEKKALGQQCLTTVSIQEADNFIQEATQFPTRSLMNSSKTVTTNCNNKHKSLDSTDWIPTVRLLTTIRHFSKSRPLRLLGLDLSLFFFFFFLFFLQFIHCTPIVCVWRDCMTTWWRRHGARLDLLVGLFVSVSLLEAVRPLVPISPLHFDKRHSIAGWKNFCHFSFLSTIQRLEIVPVVPQTCSRDSDSRYRRNGLVPTTSMKEKDVQRNRPDHAEWDTADLQSFFFLPFFLGKNCYYSTIFLSSSREGFPWEKLGEIVFPCICVFFYSLCVCEKGGKRWILDHFFGWPHTVQTCAAGYLSSQHTLGKTYAVNLVGLSVHQNEINAPLSCLRRLLPH